MLRESFRNYLNFPLISADGVSAGLTSSEIETKKIRTPQEILEALKGLRVLYNQMVSLAAPMHNLFGIVGREAVEHAVGALLKEVLPPSSDYRTRMLASAVIRDIPGDARAVEKVKQQAEKLFLEYLQKNLGLSQ